MRLFPVYGWHFLRDDHTTAYFRLPVEAGQILRIRERPVICQQGLHYCKTVRAAIFNAPYECGPVVQRIQDVGTLGGQAVSKYVTNARKCLWIADVEDILREFLRIYTPVYGFAKLVSESEQRSQLLWRAQRVLANHQTHPDADSWLEREFRNARFKAGATKAGMLS